MEYRSVVVLMRREGQMVKVGEQHVSWVNMYCQYQIPVSITWRWLLIRGLQCTY
jgi:hypothetical protein